MLKVIYTETGQHLEHIVNSVYPWVQRQQQLALSMGQTVYREFCTASILLPASHDAVEFLKLIVKASPSSFSTWAWADIDTLEVTFYGVWLSSGEVEYEGVFLVELNDHIASAIYQFWAIARAEISVMTR